ncbi:MAG: DNA replication and repair protein RecF [Pelotomaculum sp. PtaU1.Bin035]|nr:MAG: DNA replication and repair protein RecF [Pelotomaculum sp. PtaU1.Bin035]
MFLKRLELTNFRNYLRQDIEPGLLFNILTGKNAQGKTNILESIYLCCTGRSFRTLKEKELINWESEFSLIRCLLETSRREIELKALLKPGQKKIKVNGALARGYPLGWPGVVLFTPDDMVIIKGSPQERRRFLDSEIGPFNPQYGYYLNRYQRVLVQRNNLLREVREKKSKNDLLQAWNEQYCHYGSKIIFIRLALLKKANPIIRKLYRELTGDSEEIDIRYHSSVKIDYSFSEHEIFTRLTAELASIKKEEIERAQSLIGPHRDDLVFLINGNDAKVYGSQGQQRTIVLTLKIAQIQMWNNELSEYPILLLDDVLFELDSLRQKALFSRVKDKVQTFVTSTEAENINISGDFYKKLYTVKRGNILS